MAGDIPKAWIKHGVFLCLPHSTSEPSLHPPHVWWNDRFRPVDLSVQNLHRCLSVTPRPGNPGCPTWPLPVRSMPLLKITWFDLTWPVTRVLALCFDQSEDANESTRSAKRLVWSACRSWPASIELKVEELIPSETKPN